MKSPGQIAFEAYNEDRGGKSHDGSPTPDWKDLGVGVQSGWEAAARALAPKPVSPAGLPSQVQHALTYYVRDGDNAKASHDSLTDLFLDVAQSLAEHVPEGRGLAICMRYVEDLSLRAHHEVDQADSPGHPA